MEGKHAMIPSVQKETTIPFESFYGQYIEQVRRYLSGKMGNTQDAEDLTSEIFEYCFRQYHTFDPGKASLRTWLYVVVNSRYKNYLRSRRCFEDIEDYMEFTASDETPMEQAVELDCERELLARALERLPQRQREIVVQKYFLEKSAAEIGKELGMTQVNVRVQLYRALQQMKAFMQSEI